MKNKGFTYEDYLAAYKRIGTVIGVAREFNVHPRTVSRSLEGKLKTDPAIEAASSAVGTNMVPSLAWAKTKADENGMSYSVLLKPEPVSPEDIADRIADRMNKIVCAPAIQRPAQTSSDLLNFLPLFDVHLGQRVGSYGTAQAVERLRFSVRDVIDRAPKAETLVILEGGDFTEANDNSALTPQNKHPLAVDMEFDDLSDIAVDLMVEVIEYGLANADRVIYQGLKGNHDPAISVVLRQALRMRYRNEPRFKLLDGFDLFTYEWGGNLLAGIHGHQKVSKPETLTLAIAARHASAWGNSRNRELWRGHNHKELTISVPGMTMYQVNPICPHGRYANENLYTGQSDVQCVTYGRNGGRRASTVHIFQD